MANAVVPALALILVSTSGFTQTPPVVRGMVQLQVGSSAAEPRSVEADVLVIPVFAGEDPLQTILKGASEESSAAVRSAVAQGVVNGKLYETMTLFAPRGFAASRVVLMGAGEETSLDAETFRRFAGAAIRGVRADSVETVAVFVRGGLPGAAAAQSAVEGALLGLFDAGFHKTAKKPVALKSLVIAGAGSGPEVDAAIEKGRLMAETTNLARSLTVEPANYLTPAVLAAHADAIGREGNLEVRILDERQIEEKGLGGVIAVGKGSVNPPRFIDLRFRPKAPSSVTIAFVGKGVCFDSGGISLKPGSGMFRMKGDMAGGAVVLAVMQIVAELEPGVNVMGIVPAVENLPGSTAQRPGDVFTGFSGKTVEVMSTDAEGRLILSDGISYAISEGETHIVDIATLTGSVRTALGDRHVGTFASDDAFYGKLTEAAALSGESFWRLPIDDEYGRDIQRSLVADLTETGGDAGASVGAKFIQQFTEGRPWIHLDIAGLSWPSHTPPYRGEGPTGVTVRTLAELTLLLSGS